MTNNPNNADLDVLLDCLPELGLLRLESVPAVGVRVAANLHRLNSYKRNIKFMS